MSGTTPTPAPVSTLASRVLEWSRPVVAILSIVLFGASFVIAAWQKNTSILQILVGAIVSGFSTIMGYYFGSSSGSEKKDSIIASQLTTPPKP